MVPLGHCNWFWKRRLYNYWTESSSNGNSISKGKSAAISKFSLNSFVSPSKPLYHAAQSRQFWTSPKDVKHPSTNCYFCNSTVQFLDVSCKRASRTSYNRWAACPLNKIVSSRKGYCHVIDHGTSWQQSWMFIAQCKLCMNRVFSKRNNTSLKEGWYIQYFLESQTELIKKRKLHV